MVMMISESASPLTEPLTREQAIEILWSKISPETVLTEHWQHVLSSSYGWAVEALVETSHRYCLVA